MGISLHCCFVAIPRVLECQWNNLKFHRLISGILLLKFLRNNMPTLINETTMNRVLSGKERSSLTLDGDFNYLYLCHFRLNFGLRVKMSASVTLLVTLTKHFLLSSGLFIFGVIEEMWHLLLSLSIMLFK